MAEVFPHNMDRWHRAAQSPRDTNLVKTALEACGCPVDLVVCSLALSDRPREMDGVRARMFVRACRSYRRGVPKKEREGSHNPSPCPKRTLIVANCN